MRLSLKPVTIPFKVGQRVYVDQPYASLALGDDTTNNQVYFEAEIIRIFLEFPDRTSIINEFKDNHEIIVNMIIYDLKPLGDFQGRGRIALRIDLESATQTVFESEASLLDCHRQQGILPPGQIL